MQLRTEQRSDRDVLSVLIFRLERYDDAGKRVMLVPVEMRGIGFEGSIHDGDWARVSGRMRAGTLLADRLHNVTTGADVRATRTPRWQLIIAAVIICIIAAFIIAGWISMFTGDPGGPPDDWPSDWHP
ncbi:hypothetical protein ACFVZ8_06735 [Streptomyces sp. NPDC059558]|uniref:hypothetical protein n=1 Tax=unclassified Streptomyces TaxID=2593676 RepID=UPI0009C258C3|nr:hypothetical protein [Streptomyces sp. Sge12]ARE78173.1 hypothetical protein B6R96_32980 [Streptomyces sp. Sge12]